MHNSYMYVSYRVDSGLKGALDVSMISNFAKQVIIILGLQGLCFSMVEAKRYRR